MSFIVSGLTAVGGGSLLAGAGIATAVGSSIMKGFGGPSQHDINVQQTAAKEMYQEKLGLLGEQKALAGQAIQNQFASGQRNIGMGTNMALRRSQAFGEQAYSKSNLATSGTIESKVQTETKDLLGKYKSDMTKLFETRDLSKAEADLSYRKGKLSEEEAYEAMKTDISSQKVGWKLW